MPRASFRAWRSDSVREQAENLFLASYSGGVPQATFKEVLFLERCALESLVTCQLLWCPGRPRA